jgi:hypothetical protein
MNAITTTRPGTGALALLPTNMRDAMEMASMMAKAGFFPKELNNPGACLFVVEQAMRWNMSPYAVATEMSFPQGKPMFSGKLVAAAVQSSGTIQGRMHYAYSGSGADRAVTVSATLRGEAEPVSVDVRLADAKTSNQHWTKSPDQMLAYHGARVWARRYAPEVMLGVYAPEEFDDAPQAAPMPAASGPTIQGRAEPAPPAADLIMLDPQGNERAAPSVEAWGRWCSVALAKLESAEAVTAWLRAMEPHMDAAPLDAAQAVRDVAAERLAKLEPAPADDGWPGPGGDA